MDFSTPFKVRIVEDCRSQEKYGLLGNLSGHIGICLGLYDHPYEWKEDPENGNPLIRMDSGEYIWGIECWFTDLVGANNKSLTKIVEGHKRSILEKLDGPNLN